MTKTTTRMASGQRRSGACTVVSGTPATTDFDIAKGHERVVHALAPLRVYLDVLRLRSQSALVEEPSAGGLDEQAAAIYDEARMHLDALTSAIVRAEEHRARAA